MSRRRTSPYPGGWIDEGPQAAVSRTRTYATVPGAPVGDMTPVLTGTVLSMQGSHAGHGRKAQAYSIRPENRKPRCERVMRTGDVCANVKDHRDSCRSAKSLAERSATWTKRHAA